MQLQRIPLQDVNWPELDSFADRTVAQTKPWLDFLVASQGVDPVVIAIRDQNNLLGYFTGAIMQKFGLRILGSPLPGWSTSYMGFNLLPHVSRKQALAALKEFAFHELRCVHLEILDRNLLESDVRECNFVTRTYPSYEVDLSQGEERTFANMESRARTTIRKAEKKGVTIQESSDLEFADDFWPQLQEVFAKQQLAPTYSRERVRQLIKHLYPSGQLLLLRARAPDGLCIASTIFVGAGDFAYFWGAARWQEHQHYNPNEFLVWHAMRYWIARGAKRLDLGGGGAYKEKYGVTPTAIPWIHASKYPFLGPLRTGAKRFYRLAQQIAGKWKR